MSNENFTQVSSLKKQTEFDLDHAQPFRWIQFPVLARVVMSFLLFYQWQIHLQPYRMVLFITGFLTINLISVDSDISQFSIHFLLFL